MAFAPPTPKPVPNGTASNGATFGKSICELVLLGTGVSTGLPQISCVLPSARHHCAVCHDGLKNVDSPNRRCNVCALLRIGGRTVLIDCGKTIRESALRFLPRLGVGSVDAIVLTHGHADAMLGLDDFRDLQLRPPKDAPLAPPTPVFLSDETHTACKRVFPYLMPGPGGTKPGAEGGVERRVANIDWRPFPEGAFFTPFRPLPDIDVEFIPVPLLHGGDYICLGFIIRVGGTDGTVIAYLSDVKEVPTETMDFLRTFDHIDILIVDALGKRTHQTHFTLEEATNLARVLRPGITRCVGMGCRLGLHDEVNSELRTLRDSEGLDIELGYDGQQIPL